MIELPYKIHLSRSQSFLSIDGALSFPTPSSTLCALRHRQAGLESSKLPLLNYGKAHESFVCHSKPMSTTDVPKYICDKIGSTNNKRSLVDYARQQIAEIYRENPGMWANIDCYDPPSASSSSSSSSASFAVASTPATPALPAYSAYKGKFKKERDALTDLATAAVQIVVHIAL